MVTKLMLTLPPHNVTTAGGKPQVTKSLSRQCRWIVLLAVNLIAVPTRSLFQIISCSFKTGSPVRFADLVFTLLTAYKHGSHI